jgi:hypothetical protein
MARTLAIDREPGGATAPATNVRREAFTWTPVAVVDIAGGSSSIGGHGGAPRARWVPSHLELTLLLAVVAALPLW